MRSSAETQSRFAGNKSRELGIGRRSLMAFSSAFFPIYNGLQRPRIRHRKRLLQRSSEPKCSYVSHDGSLVMRQPYLTIHHMVRVYPDGRFDYRTPLSMGRPDPEQSLINYGTAVGNNAPLDWSGWMYLDCHIPRGAPLRRGIGCVPAAIIPLST